MCVYEVVWVFQGEMVGYFGGFFHTCCSIEAESKRAPRKYVAYGERGPSAARSSVESGKAVCVRRRVVPRDTVTKKGLFRGCTPLFAMLSWTFYFPLLKKYCYIKFGSVCKCRAASWALIGTKVSRNARVGGFRSSNPCGSFTNRTDAGCSVFA